MQWKYTGIDYPNIARSIHPQLTIHYAALVLRQHGTRTNGMILGGCRIWHKGFGFFERSGDGIAFDGDEFAVFVTAENGF